MRRWSPACPGLVEHADAAERARRFASTSPRTCVSRRTILPYHVNVDDHGFRRGRRRHPERTYYSVGGGLAGRFRRMTTLQNPEVSPLATEPGSRHDVPAPHLPASGAQLLAACDASGLECRGASFARGRRRAPDLSASVTLFCLVGPSTTDEHPAHSSTPAHGSRCAPAGAAHLLPLT